MWTKYWQGLQNCIVEDKALLYSHFTGTIEQQSDFIASYVTEPLSSLYPKMQNFDEKEQEGLLKSDQR